MMKDILLFDPITNGMCKDTEDVPGVENKDKYKATNTEIVKNRQEKLYFMKVKKANFCKYVEKRLSHLCGKVS